MGRFFKESFVSPRSFVIFVKVSTDNPLFCSQPNVDGYWNGLLLLLFCFCVLVTLLSDNILGLLLFLKINEGWYCERIAFLLHQQTVKWFRIIGIRSS